MEHENPPEVSGRLKAILSYVERSKLPVKFEEPKKIDEADLLLVHSGRMVDELKERSATERSEPENPFTKKTFEIAKLACGGALRAAEIADDEGFSFALVRPPGHHAGRDFFQGFCYMNNLAFAVRKNQKGRRALIVDFDVHHGNGTQDIFYKDESVFYLSVHQDPHTLFPYRSGFVSENNSHVKNMPLPPGAGDGEFVNAMKEGLKAARKFGPEFVAVSAGFDSYSQDGIAELRVAETKTFSLIGKEIAKLKLPTFGVLEGGYYLPDLGKNVWGFLSAFL